MIPTLFQVLEIRLITLSAYSRASLGLEDFPTTNILSHMILEWGWRLLMCTVGYLTVSLV